MFYGSGSISEGVKNTAFNVFLLFYYNAILGLSGTLAGTAIFVALCFDAVTDPLVGSLSDNFRSRWGRRHPFMYAAPVPMAVCFVLLFNPPQELNQIGLFFWLSLFAIGVRVSMTLYAVPSMAMLSEITQNYDERTNLVSFRYLFGWLGGLTLAQLGYLYFFAPSDQFNDGRLDPEAYGSFALACGVVVCASILSCTAGTHRLIPTIKPPSARARFGFRAFAADLRSTFRNRSFVMLTSAVLFASVAGGFSDVIGLYVNTYFWEFRTDQIAILVIGLAIAVLLAFSLTPPLARRTDKKKSALALATLATCVGPVPIFLRLINWLPENGSPLLLPIIFVHATVVVGLVVAIGIITTSMLADVIDENEFTTKRQQGGLLSSAITFTNKAASGVGSLLAGIAIDIIAFPSGVEPGSVPQEKVRTLGVVVGPGLMLLYLTTLVFLTRYQITRAHHAHIMAELDRRKTTLPVDQ